MIYFKLITRIFFVFLLVFGQQFFLYSPRANAAFDIQGVELFKDNNICITMTSSGTVTQSGFSLTSLQSNSESFQANITSGGALCPLPPFFTGGAIQTTTNGITIQAQPTVQALGRGIVISEIAGNSSGVSSSGDPAGFTALVSRLGGVSMTLFEISLPTGCDVIDDDNDVVGASTDLTTINDFSFPTCASTNGLTVQCNAESNLLTAITGLAPATSSTPAKIRFTISAFDAGADVNMIDSILIKLDSQDVFCPTSVTGPITATIIAKNAVDSPTVTETIGTVNIGNATQAVNFKYATETATSLKGETSTNDIGSTALLIGGSATAANKIQIEELQNDSIPIAGQSSAALINPSVTLNAENNIIYIWLVPSISNLFSTAPASSNISFSDNSLIVQSAPYIVRSNNDDLNAPFGTLVIPVKKNDATGATDPSTIKSTITVSNLVFGQAATVAKDATVTLALYESVSGAIVNTPAALSVNNSTNLTNPQNFSAFSVGSTRALAQNAVVGGAVNESTGAAQIISDTDLNALTLRNTALGATQIAGFTKAISTVTPIDVSKITATTSNSVVTVTGSDGAAISGAKVKIESFANSSMTVFDSVTVTSKNTGAFTAKLQGDFSKGDVTLNLKQTVNGTDSTQVSKTVSQQSSLTSSSSGGLACENTVCGCENRNCTPTFPIILNYVQTNGGLSKIVSSGGSTLTELINSIKKALGLS